MDALRASQYILGCDISLIVFILYHWAKRGFLKVAFSFDSMRFVETLCPCAVFIFRYEDVGALLKSLQFSYLISWNLVIMNPDS